ncbi:MAG: hypothetical protein WAQ52_18560 [Terriglobales bacterium]
MSDQPGLLREGFRRVWHYQRVLWWMFFVNLLLALLGAWPALDRMHDVADHSLRARRLVDMFDVGDFSALSSNPEINLYAGHDASIHFGIVFFFFALFLTGGILEAYRSGRRLTTREFFEACGSYFWAWVRLLILMAIVLIPALMLVSFVWKRATDLMLNAAQEKAGFWFLIAGMGAVGLLLMCIRLWFDMAQVRAVVEEETGMWRNAGRALKLTLANFGSLFWMYLRISLLGWLVFAAGLYVWAKMPPARFWWTILILELVVLWGFGTRLWQRACEMIWYQRRFLAPIAAPASTPAAPPPNPLLTIAPPPASDLPSQE